MAKKFLLAIFSVLLLAIPSFGQTSLGYTPPAAAAYCIHNGAWIPMLTSSLANPINYTPPPTALFVQNGSSWYGLPCDSNGNISGNATSLQGTPLAAIAPTPGQSLKFNGTSYVANVPNFSSVVGIGTSIVVNVGSTNPYRYGTLSLLSSGTTMSALRQTHGSALH